MWHASEALPVPPGLARLVPLVRTKRVAGRPKVQRAVDFVVDTLAAYKSLCRQIERCRPDVVLLSAWSEYFAPLWAPKFRWWRARGVRFGAVIHDPVRDFIRGPVWWHRYSVRQAYSFLDVAFTHDDTTIDICGSRAPFKKVVVPHGPYPVEAGSADKVALRREFGIPEDADVMLSFGHIRDGKNLDQIIAALPALPKAHLLVAGREQSGGQKPVGFYRDLAQHLGVGNRCHWRTDYIPNDEVWKYYRASDVLMLTYSKDFRSASGVLSVNAQFGLPVIASAGGGPLLKTTRKYGLGVVIDYPEADLIAAAFAQTTNFSADWERFASENSWETNAKLVAEALGQRLGC
jgi:glycosyltransferase involved in cell wall biosynthesis